MYAFINIYLGRTLAYLSSLRFSAIRASRFESVHDSCRTTARQEKTLRRAHAGRSLNYNGNDDHTMKDADDRWRHAAVAADDDASRLNITP